jgi:hypothetical protein
VRSGDSEARIAPACVVPAKPLSLALACRPDAGAGAGAGAGAERWRVAGRTRTVDGRSVEARCDRRPLAPRRLMPKHARRRVSGVVQRRDTITSN